MDQSGDGKITLAEFEMMFENEGTNMADALLPQWFFLAGQPHTFMVYIYIYIHIISTSWFNCGICCWLLQARIHRRRTDMFCCHVLQDMALCCFMQMQIQWNRAPKHQPHKHLRTSEMQWNAMKCNEMLYVATISEHLRTPSISPILGPQDFPAIAGNRQGCKPSWKVPRSTPRTPGHSSRLWTLMATTSHGGSRWTTLGQVAENIE